MPLSDVAKEEIRLAKQVPVRFKREVHNAADWLFLPATSVASYKAAKFLGLGDCTFLKNVDLFGLTVLYKSRKGKTGRVDKFFLLSELHEVKRKLESASFEDALKSAEVGHEYFRQTKKKAKIRRILKSRTG